MKLIAIDPYDCGCTECCTGEYKPLCYATADDIADLLAGRLRSNLHTGDTLDVQIKYVYTSRNGRLEKQPDTVTVSYDCWNGLTRTWDVDPYRAGLIKD